jgi:hypothetical protein
MKIVDVKFLTPLWLEALDDDSQWRLLADFSAGVTTEDGYEIIDVPKGFVTDLASVPRLPFLFTLFGGRARHAAVIHDWLYSERKVSRELADAIFFRAMAHNQGWFTRTAMWLGVRVGGWAIWNRRPVPTLPESVG